MSNYRCMTDKEVAVQAEALVLSGQPLPQPLAHELVFRLRRSVGLETRSSGKYDQTETHNHTGERTVSLC